MIIYFQIIRILTSDILGVLISSCYCWYTAVYLSQLLIYCI
nr:MAG TPA: hypothetical protein [Caudoviricetes sp.]